MSGWIVIPGIIKQKLEDPLFETAGHGVAFLDTQMTRSISTVGAGETCLFTSHGAQTQVFRTTSLGMQTV